MIQLISAVVWLTIALTGFVRILRAFDAYHEDIDLILTSRDADMAERARYLAIAKNQRFRYTLRQITVVNDFVLGAFSIIEGIHSLNGQRGTIETLVFTIYFLLSVYFDQLVINILTEHDLWSRDVADGAFSYGFGRWLWTVTPRGIIKGLYGLPGRAWGRR
jgi:hypothetical protein